jgi:ParB-like chromosome segregation protein Spo0J
MARPGRDNVAYSDVRDEAAPISGRSPLICLEYSDLQVVPLTDLSVAYSPRRPLLDDDHLAALTPVVDRLPPVVVFQPTMTVIDGIHRLEVFRKSGRTHIEAVFVSGDDTEALALAIQANVSHGKPLSRVERYGAVVTLLRRCPERSDRWLGEICGLSHSTVARLRRTSLEAEVTGGAPTRLGRDGRRRPIDPTTVRAGVTQVINERPTMSLRKMAAAAGVAPSTVRRTMVGVRGPPSVPSETVAASRPDDRIRNGRAFSVEDPAFSSTPPLAEIGAWLARTSVTADDLHYLEDVPLGHIYDVADECRRRAKVWAEMADMAEKRAR